MVLLVAAVTLLLITEIDASGKDIIHVAPNNIKAIQATVANGGLTP